MIGGIFQENERSKE